MSDLAPDDLLQHTALSEPRNSEPSRGMWGSIRDVLGHPITQGGLLQGQTVLTLKKEATAFALLFRGECNQSLIQFAMNILQERFLAQRSAARTDAQDGVNGRQRTRLRVTEWSDGVGTVRDREGYEYSVNVQNLAPGIEGLVAGDFVEGFVKDFQTVQDIMPVKRADLSKSILVPVIECPNKNEVKAYVERLANTGQLRNVPGSLEHPYAVEGAIIQNGIHWSVVLVPAGSRLSHDRPPTVESEGPAPDVRGWTPQTGNPNYSTGKPNTGDNRKRF
jgi:hypothetical protein